MLWLDVLNEKERERGRRDGGSDKEGAELVCKDACFRSVVHRVERLLFGNAYGEA